MNTTTPPRAENDALAAALLKHRDPQLLTLGEIEGEKVQVLLAPNSSGSIDVRDVRKHFDAYRKAPERRTGTAALTTIDSFIEHVNRFKDADSALFVDPDREKPSLTAILNYHKQGAAGAPRFGDHKSHYAFPLSDEWAAWNKNDGEKMLQADFTAFIEERALDIINPPPFDSTEEADIRLREFATSLNSVFADRAKMIELSRGLEVREKKVVANAVKLENGGAKIIYQSEHVGADGEQIVVPNLFVIAIPVFVNGPAYRLPVRLRYKLNGANLVWTYDLYKPERAFDDAVKEAADKAKTETGLPAFYGAAE